MTATLDAWIERQYLLSASGLLAGMSRADLVRTRAGRQVRPQRGSVVASPAPGAYDPDPDYFFHWYRDAALAVDALRLLHVQEPEGGAAPYAAVDGATAFADFVRFSAGLATLDGRVLADDRTWRSIVPAAMVPYLRTDDELARVHGDAVAAEARVNPDGTLDVLRWARPQHDGPALRALAVLRWLQSTDLQPEVAADAAALLHSDLRYVAAHARRPGFDIWEEEPGLHYYTLSVAAAALARGADWLDLREAASFARACRDQADAILAELDAYWLDADGLYCARAPATMGRHDKDPDIAIVLAALHSGRLDGPHSVRDPRVHATLARLDELFDAGYAINRDRPAGRGPALGRYRDDSYYAGGAYYFATLAAAELCFRSGQRARGDAYLETVRAYAPAGGELPEQFDGRTGAPASARQLTWSHAAYIACIAARRRQA